MSHQRAKSPDRSAALRAQDRRRTRLKLASVFVGSFLLLLAGNGVYAQEDEGAPATENSVTNDGLGNRPIRFSNDAFRTDPSVGVSYRELFRNTRSPYQPALRTPDANVNFHDAGVGLRVGLLDVENDFSLISKGFDPQRADLKVGPVYFKLNALTGAILASDNPDLSATDRNPDAIAVVELAATVMAKFSESLSLAITGRVVWLPLEGRVGLASGDLLDDFALELAKAQLSWDTRIGGWDVFLSDTARVFQGYTNSSGAQDYYLFQSDMSGDLEPDRAGRYTLGAVSLGHTRRSQRTLDNLGIDSVAVSNEVSGVAERLLPGPVRLRLRVFHEDLWYNQGARGLPTLREGGSVTLQSEHENWRFNPFLHYEAFRTDLIDGFSHRVVAGIGGPITDQLYLNLYAGLYESDNAGGSRVLAGLRLRHEAGPYTRESLFVGREIDDYAQDQYDSVRYGILQTLGPRLKIGGFLSYGTITDLQNTNSVIDEFRARVRLEVALGPRTDLGLVYGYRHGSSNNAGFLLGESDTEDIHARYDIETYRLELGYHITNTLRARLLYQYQDRNSTIGADSYTENLVLLSLTKYFD